MKFQIKSGVKATKEAKSLAKSFIASFLINFVLAIAQVTVELRTYLPAMYILIIIISLLTSIEEQFVYGEVPSNPVPLIADFFMGRRPFMLVFVYISIQLMGAILAMGLTTWIVPNISVSEHLMLKLENDVSWHQALIMTTVVAFTSTILAELMERTHEDARPIVPFYLGMIGIVVTIMSYGIIDAAGFNTMRVTAPAIMSRDYEDLWIYWVGNVLGVIIGVLITEWFIIPHDSDKPENS